MSNIYFCKKPAVGWFAVSLMAGLTAAAGSSVLAATKAGTEIKNLATVTYEDAAGNVYTSQSNEAIVTVAQVYAASIGTDVNASASPGQTVYLPYLLSNDGNGPDTFDLSAVDGITGGDSLDADNIEIYHDTNGNGQPDSGEPVVSSMVLDGSAANNFANLVVAVQVPNTATGGQTIGITLTAQAQQGTGSAVAGSVTDLSAGGGLDGADDTNESLITVTGDAVLVTTKSSVHDLANNRITYTVTVKNNGNSAATNVVIWDAYPEFTALVGGSESASGLLISNGDTPATDAALDETVLALDLNADTDQTDVTEADFSLDLNNDGDTADGAANGVYAIDADLAPNATVSLTYTVSYDPNVTGGGHQIQNTAYVTGDVDGDGNPDTPVASNTTTDTVSQAYGVTISDSGAGAGVGVNDGGDDDSAVNDTQLVDTAASGGPVWFDSVVTNTGNGDDTFELAVNPGSFPVGTLFTFWDATGAIQLFDTNSFQGIDTGTIAAGASLNIKVRATLPAGVSGNNGGAGYQASISATSAGDPSGTPASDPTNISLTTITSAVVDIHNAANGALGSDEDALGSPEYTAVTTLNGPAGTTVLFPLYLDNETSGADSYQLSAGGAWDGTTLGALPAGWSVTFYLGNGAGSPTGGAITATPSIPGGQLDFEIIAEVTIPSTASQALVDVQYDNDNDGTAETLDGNTDGDGDYPIFFRAVSTSSGAADIKLDAVDVDVSHSLAMTPNGVQQVEAGGSATFPHTLSNNGNVTEVVEISGAQNQSGWSHTISVDTNGDGVIDTELGNLAVGTIDVQQGNGAVITLAVSDNDSDGVFELAIPPGADIPLEAVVFAPASAPSGITDTLTLGASDLAGAVTATANDQTQVIDSLVRLDKTVAVDTNCDGTADTAFDPVQSVEVAPGQCAIWRIVANNQGTADALNVIVTDSITGFTTYQTGSLELCVTSGCTPASVSDASADDLGEINAGNITFYIGTGADGSTGAGGTLVAGEYATMQFRVSVD